MLGLVTFYLVTTLLSVAFLPVSNRLFAHLPDRGVFINRTLSVFLLGVLIWLFSAYGLASLSGWGPYFACLAALVLAAICLSQMNGEMRAVTFSDFSSYRILLFASELLFLVVFLGWCLFRSSDPAANHTEQPMDFMFLNAVSQALSFPPEDPWLAGYPVSYYYFGYWLMASVGQLAGQSPDRLYNLGQALWFGLLSCGCFGMGFNLHLLRKGPAARSTRSASITGLVCFLSVAIIGNLVAPLQWLYARGWLPVEALKWTGIPSLADSVPPESLWHIGTDWWWWESSRVLHDQAEGVSIELITEFPFFSYLLGDNHPHLLAMPFSVLLLTLLLELWTRAEKSDHSDLQQRNSQTLLHWMQKKYGLHQLIVTALLLGALLMTNTWDVPALLALTFVIIVISVGVGGVPWKDRLLKFTGTTLFVGLVSLLLCWPYLLTAQSQVGGLSVNSFSPTKLRQFFLVTGTILPGVLLFLWAQGQKSKSSRVWKNTFIIGFSLLLSVSFLLTLLDRGFHALFTPQVLSASLSELFQRWYGSPWTILLLVLSVGWVLALLLIYLQRTDDEWSQRARTEWFLMLLAAAGLSCLLLPEFVFIEDSFQNRMNTVFKFYYQAWLLLGIVSSTYLAGCLARPVQLPAAALAILIPGVVFPVTASYSKSFDFRANRSLEATTHLQQWEPELWDAIAWMRKNCPPDSRVAEAPGSSYDPSSSRVSTFTGLSTLLGWEGHEVQWRGPRYSAMTAGRREALASIFGNSSIPELASILEKWQIDYVYVGERERAVYGVEEKKLSQLQKLLIPAFRNNSVEIFQVPSHGDTGR